LTAAALLGASTRRVTALRLHHGDAPAQNLGLIASEDYEAAVVPPKARAVLARFDERSQHYEVRVDRLATG